MKPTIGHDGNHSSVQNLGAVIQEAQDPEEHQQPLMKKCEGEEITPTQITSYDRVSRPHVHFDAYHQNVTSNDQILEHTFADKV